MAAAKKKPEVAVAYDMMRAIKTPNKKIIKSEDIEEEILGRKFIDNINDYIHSTTKQNNKILSGNEIMDILCIPPGIEVGYWVDIINNAKEFSNIDRKHDIPLDIKKQAKKLLIQLEGQKNA